MDAIPMKLTNHRCQCAECGKYFSRTSSFDKHRTGKYGEGAEKSKRRCMTDAEMRAKGMATTSTGVWLGSQRHV